MKLPFQKEARSFSHSENLPKTIKKASCSILECRIPPEHPQATALQESPACKKPTISTGLILFFF